MRTSILKRFTHSNKLKYYKCIHKPRILRYFKKSWRQPVFTWKQIAVKRVKHQERDQNKNKWKTGNNNRLNNQSVEHLTHTGPMHLQIL